MNASINTVETRTGFSSERVNYFDRQIITASDMIAEQRYFQEKMRRHNRFLHGWGVVAGLNVSAAPIPGEPGRVRVDCGYALSPQGDEIYIPEAFCFDLLRCGLGTVSDPCEPGMIRDKRPAGDLLRLFIAVRYSECPSRPVRIHPTGCGCDASGCAFTRVREEYAVECLLDLPVTHRPQKSPAVCDLRAGGLNAACPVCPDDPWVVIAQVRWNPQEAITNQDISNKVSRQLYSTGMLQSQVIDCCCEDRRPPSTQPATVVSVEPRDKAVFTGANAPDAITVTFDKALNPQSITKNSMQVMFRTPQADQQALEGSIQYQEAKNAIRFTPSQPLSRLLRLGSPVQLLVRVNGSGEHPVRDADDMVIDGNRDGTEGGDFSSRFELLSPDG